MPDEGDNASLGVPEGPSDRGQGTEAGKGIRVDQPSAFSADRAHRHIMPRTQGTQIPSHRSQDAAERFPSRGNHPHDFTKSLLFNALPESPAIKEQKLPHLVIDCPSPRWLDGKGAFWVQIQRRNGWLTACA